MNDPKYLIDNRSDTLTISQNEYNELLQCRKWVMKSNIMKGNEKAVAEHLKEYEYLKNFYKTNHKI